MHLTVCVTILTHWKLLAYIYEFQNAFKNDLTTQKMETQNVSVGF